MFDLRLEPGTCLRLSYCPRRASVRSHTSVFPVLWAPLLFSIFVLLPCRGKSTSLGFMQQGAKDTAPRSLTRNSNSSNNSTSSNTFPGLSLGESLPLVLNSLTSGSVLSQGVVAYSVDVSPCQLYGTVLLELLSATFQALPQNLSAFPPGSGSSTSEPLPMLLVDAQGALPVFPQADSLTYQTPPGPALTSVDAPDYYAQQPVQYGLYTFPPNSTANSSNANWTLAVLADTGKSPNVGYFLQASCGPVPLCPAACGGPSRGLCLSPGRCQCIGLWGGATCTTLLHNLTADNGTDLQLGPGEWLYYAFSVPQPSANVLLDVSCFSGNLAVFMKPAGDGYLLNGLPTGNDAGIFSDVAAFQFSLPWHSIYWHEAQPGRAYIGIWNTEQNRALQANLSFTLYVQPPGPGAEPLCPFNCSYPKGTCVHNASHYPTCNCISTRAGQFCEADVEIWSLDVTKNLSVGERSLVYIKTMVEERCETNVSVDIQYSGGNLYALFGVKGSMPPVSNLSAFKFPAVITNGESSVLYMNVSSLAPLVLGLYNSAGPREGTSYLDITFWCLDNVNTSFIDSPYMISLMSILGVVCLAFFTLLLRRVLPCYSSDGDASAATRVGAPRLDDLARVQLEGGGNWLAGARLGAQGIPQDVIASFPLVAFQADACAPSQEAQCAVCLGEYEAGEVLKMLPGCNHLFHESCIGEWLSRHCTCPCCRNLLDKDVPARTEQPVNEGQQVGHEEGAAEPIGGAHLEAASAGREVQDARVASQLHDVGGGLMQADGGCTTPAAAQKPDEHCEGPSQSPQPT